MEVLFKKYFFVCGYCYGGRDHLSKEEGQHKLDTTLYSCCETIIFYFC